MKKNQVAYYRVQSSDFGGPAKNPSTDRQTNVVALIFP